MEKLIKGLVKGVPSGDCVVISGKIPRSGDGIPEETTLYLTGIQTPRCANSQRLNDEESFAWESICFIRKMIAGKVISYKKDFVSNDKTYGQVYIENKNVAIEMIKNGYAKTGFIPKANENILKSDYWNKIKEEEEVAKKNKLNIWSDNKENKRTLCNVADQGFDMEKVKKLIKDQSEVDAVIEYVFNCSFVALYIPCLNAFCKFNIRFIAIPSAKEPLLSKAGKLYLERVSLHQDVKVRIYSFDDSKNLIGDIKGVKGSIAGNILKEGYAKVYISNNVPYTVEDLNMVKSFQEEAKNKRIGVWKNEPISNTEKKVVSEKVAGVNYEDVTCFCVNSGDSITIMDHSGEQVRLFLSNLKAPNFAKPNTTEEDQPWAFQAKEYLRKILVGKKLKCEFDYAKAAKDDRTMNFYTVYYTNDNPKSKEFGQEKCLNVDLCQIGFASLTTIKIDDGHPSRKIEEMRAAEQEAKDKKAGIFSKKIPPIPNFSDMISANKNKKREFISFLSGLKDAKCVVDFCFSGFKYKLRIDEKHVYIPFSILGIKTFTKDKNNTDLFEKYYKMSLSYVNDTILQRDGVCDIEQADRIGNYFGNFFFNNKNFAVDLVSKGFAVIDEQSYKQNRYLSELKSAEKLAKSNKLGIWENEDLANLLKYGEGGNVSSSSKLVEVNKDVKLRITEYIDFHNFYANVLPNQTLTKIEKVLAECDRNKSKCIPLELPIKIGTICAAKYSEDFKYYRAVIQGRTKEGKYSVRFLDYGNEEIVPLEDLIKLDGEIAPLPAQCIFCELAYLKYSKNSMEKAVKKYPNFADIELAVNGKICYTYNSDDGEKNGVVVYIKEKNIKNSYHSELMKIGYAKLDRSKKLPEYFKDLDASENVAKEKGLGIWAENEETDYLDDEEEEI